jgi:hypothetical protein
MKEVISEIKFEPWVGEEYLSGIDGKRLLVLGESHYHSCEDDPECREGDSDEQRETSHRGLTKRVVGFWKDWPHRSPLSHSIPKLFSLEKPEFWKRVAFYNYLQAFCGSESACSPKRRTMV